MTTTTTRPRGRERRDRTLGGRVARATFPARQAADEWLSGFPCNVISHRWVEIPPSLRSPRARAAGVVQFSCARCGERAGFTS